MIETISGWVRAIAAISLIMAVISVITPKNAAGRAVMLCASIIMTAVLVSPLKTFDVSGFSEYYSELDLEINKMAKNVSSENQKLKESIIEENLRTYILQRTEQMEVNCDVQVLCKDGVPYSANVKLGNEKDREKVSEILEAECGIKKDNQKFEVSE